MIRILIVDDEPLAREGIRNFLEDEADVQIVGEAGNGQEAVSAIEHDRPDLVFLDIQMPELDGFGVLSALDPDTLPTFIFVTAYDQYALQAFEVHALDYLLKPVERARFNDALVRARSSIEHTNDTTFDARVAELLTELKKTQNIVERLVIKDRGRVYFVKTNEVDWIEAAGNYVRIHVGSDRHLLRETMHSLERKLDPNEFARIHRSTIVNLDRVKEIQPWFKGEHVVLLNDGTRLSLTRKYREQLQQWLGRGI